MVLIALIVEQNSLTKYFSIVELSHNYCRIHNFDFPQRFV